MNKIHGIGSDIIEISRIKESCERYHEKFIDKLFTEKEKIYCQKYKDPHPRYAGRFAAKEAIVKALGTGFGKDAHFHDIEILADDLGKPIARLAPPLQQKGFEIHLTITHSIEYAVAFAIITT